MKKSALFTLGAVAALLLSACGSSNEETSAETTSAQEGEQITFTHPTIDGLELEFENQPETLVMDCYAYSSLHEYGLKPDALFGYECDNSALMGDADTAGIEKIGQDGEIDIEKLAELRPDVIIGNGNADGWSWFDDDVNAQLLRVAPFVPLPSEGSIDEKIADTREIADFLGADVEADNIVAADADLDEAKEAFTSAVDGKDFNFLLASPTKEMLYTGVGFAQADLLEELGATIVGPDAPAEGNPWGKVAWEDASTYPADVILVENYDEEAPFTAELWDNLPAVQADQVSTWSSKGALTSRTYADWLQDLADKVNTYNKVA
ncbi:iron-siderophore uptake ABC system substrate-binding component [Corynebacterium suranareeae]|uniref:Iron-siderophore uptake ABC system substrate-binding component n=1 Tax=Corynebacterium suranareeae TaxID=2506452 RepID=A0A169S3K5_9CORY|nr:ABC transporter substrate-binding protein [Corynebacterium suranareeae]BAU97058.1 iron-siderophore uptake ABC system substrate-binding component [Corynebacterium suranareeae]